MSRKSTMLIPALLMAAMSFVCNAQVEQGAITGTVTDPTGSSIPAAKVTATNQATGTAAVAETTAEGYYKIPYLAAGKYTVTVEKDGFSANKFTDVPVLVGETATINSSLKTGSVHDAVTVESRAVMIEEATSSLGYVTGVTQILELPIGRSPYSMLTLSPGVIPDGNTGTGPIVNGGRSNTTAILMDGQDTRNNSTLDNNYTPPQESIQEIRFITNSFSAEYGRSNGGVLAAAGKTGANLIHGSAYDYLQNDDLNANSWTSNKNGVARGRQRVNTFGFSLSGPVYIPRLYNGKNKTFFFVNMEFPDNHGVSTPTANVPTDLQRSGDFSQTFTSSGAQIVIYDPTTTVRTPLLKAATSGRRSQATSSPRTASTPSSGIFSSTIRSRRSRCLPPWASTGPSIFPSPRCNKSISPAWTRTLATRTGLFSRFGSSAFAADQPLPQQP